LALENRKFKNKGELFWFNVFEAVTSNYLNKEGDDNASIKSQSSKKSKKVRSNLKSDHKRRNSSNKKKRTQSVV